MASKREVAIIIKAIDKASRVMRSISNAATKDLKSVGDAAKNAATSIGLIGAALSLTLGLVISTTAAFEQSMANTQSVIGATVDELGLLTDAAREMGKVSVFSASQAADAMFFLASAGLNTERVIAALPGTMDLAAATMSDLAFTTETVVSTLAAFGLQAQDSDRIANVFAATISGSQATMERLATAMSFVAPVANSVNLSIEETSALLGRLFTSGIAASTAGTALRMAFAKLLKPTDEMIVVLDRLGIVVQTSDGNIRNFIEIIRDLERTGLTAADAMAIFGVRAGPAMLALVNQGASAIDNLVAKITDTNKASEMAALQISTFQGQMRLLKSASQELQIVIGTQLLPTLTEMVQKVTVIVTKTADWTKEQTALTKAIGATAIVVTGLAVSLSGIGFLIFGITKAVAPLQKAVIFLPKALFALGNTTLILKVRLALLGKGILGLAGIVGGGIIAGLGVFGGALALVKHEADEAKKSIDAVFGRQRANIEGIKAALARYKQALEQVKDAQDKGARSVSLLGTVLKDSEGKVRGLDAAFLPVNAQVLRLREKIADLEKELRLASGDIFLMNKELSEASTLIQALFNPFKILGEAFVKISEDAKTAAEAFSVLRGDMAFLKGDSATVKGIEASREHTEKWAAAVGKLRDVMNEVVPLISAGGGSGTSLETRESFQLLVKRLSMMSRLRRIMGDLQLMEIPDPPPIPLPSPLVPQPTEEALEEFELAFASSQGRLKDIALLRMDEQVEAFRAANLTDEQIVAFTEARKAQIEQQFVDNRKQQIDEIAQKRIAAEQDLFTKLNSIRESAFDMEQNRIKQMGQSYAGFVRSAINIGRQFFSAQEEGWIRALAATVRFITKIVAGYLRQRSLEKLKQADQAKTAAQFQLQHSAKMAALAVEAGVLSAIAFATGNIASGTALAVAAATAGADALKSVGVAAIFEGQAAKLQTEAAGLMTAAVAVEVAGAVVAGGLDLAADKVRRVAREEEELARTKERRLDTEIRLKQQILELEGRTIEAKKLGIADEISQLRELKVDENLIRQFEQLSIAQANLDADGARINTSASTNTALRNAASDIANAGQIASSGLEDAADSARRITRDGQDNFIDVGLELETTLTSLAIAVKSAGQVAASGIQNVADAAQNINLGGNIIRQLDQSPIIDIIDNIGTALGTIAKKFTDAMESIKAATMGVSDLLKSATVSIESQANALKNNISAFVDDINKIATSAIQNISIIAPDIDFGDDIVKQFEDSPIIDVMDRIGSALDTIAGKFTEAMETIKTAPTGIVDLLNSTAIGIDTLTSSVVADISGMVTTIGEMITTGIQNISIPSIEFNDDLVKQFEQSPIVDVIKSIGNSLDIIAGTFITAMESIKNAGTSILGLLNSVASNIGIQSNSIRENVASIIDAVNENVLSGMQNIVIPNIEFNDDIIKQFDESPLVDIMDRVSDALDAIVEKFVISMESIMSAATGVVDFLKTITTGIEIQSDALQAQAIAMVGVAKSIETAGTIAASGIDQSTMAIDSATQQEIASNKETVRQLGTELQLRQQIFNSEKDASASRQIAIENEISKLGQIGIDDSLLDSLEQLSLSQTSTQITDAIMAQVRSQIDVLGSETVIMSDAAKAVKTTGEVVASGIKLASDAALSATRQEMEHGREVERRLSTELQLRRDISVMEGQTFDARRLAIQDEMARFREMGIDENLLRRFERIATEQPQESTGVVGVDTGLATTGLNGNAPATPQTVITQQFSFVGIASVEDQVQLTEWARQLKPILDDLEELETTA